MLRKYVKLRRFLILTVPLLALLPVGRLVLDWVEMSAIIGNSVTATSTRGYDWVRWRDQDGVIVADYVFSRSPAGMAGIQVGDVFYELDGMQYFNAADLQHAIEGMRPGRLATFSLQRGDENVEAQVRITRYPTFLYPLSTTLWQFSLWGFTLGSFVHILALVIVVPLAFRSKSATFSLVLILLSSFWIIGNLLRLLMIEVAGRTMLISPLPDALFRGLTFVGLVGWIGFPAFLLHKVLSDSDLLSTKPWRSYLLIYLPAVVLGGGMLMATLRPVAGPLTQDALIAPILFYASVYIGSAALIAFGLHLTRPETAARRLVGWNRKGSLITFIAALFAALFVLGVLPAGGAVPDITAGWLIVAGQLLSVAPVILVSIATLQRGKIDAVIRRGLVYLTVLGALFFSFLGGMALIDPYLLRVGAPRNAVAGLYVIVLLLVFERVARSLRVYAATFFMTERIRTRRQLGEFQEQIRTIMNLDVLARQAVSTIALAFGSRSVVLYLHIPEDGLEWRATSYNGGMPFVPEDVLLRIWPHMEQEGRIWAVTKEINESTLSPELSRTLKDTGVTLAVPILGERTPLGLLFIGPRRHRRAVYNLEDIDLLRSLGSQMALAIDRINLLEREKALIRETAEAQLVALRAQINPHFLFNALNTIASLIEERPSEAESAVEHLSAIFRHVLQTGSKPFVTVQDEMQLVRHYLGIEQARFGEKLQIEMCYEPETCGFQVPAFAVQTLVENAVKHGVEKLREGGRITVECRTCNDGFFEVIVSDTGAGIPGLFELPEGSVSMEEFFGIGLRNVASRLTQLYGRTDLMNIVSGPQTGTRVRLHLPCHTAGTSDLPESSLHLQT